MSGNNSSDTKGYLTPFCLSVITENEVTSEPVPLVVGIAINLISFNLTNFLEKSIIALVASIADPPPKAITILKFL